MTETPQVFFTSTSLLTLGGASLAVVTVSKTIRTLFKRDSPVPAFVVSMAVCFASAYSLEVLSKPVDVLVAGPNSCLLFCTALGMNEAGAQRRRLKPRGGAVVKPEKVGWWSSWLSHGD